MKTKMRHKKITTYLIPAACLIIAGSVMLSGVRAKDLFGALSMVVGNAVDSQKTFTDTDHVAKLASDLHHHNDTSLKIQISDGHQSDTRSLRLLNEHSKKSLQRARLADKFKDWWRTNIVRSA